MSRTFNEATRVQIPAMVHLLRLGYKYLGKIAEDDSRLDKETNILLDVFRDQFEKLNPDCADRTEETLNAIRVELDNKDLGRAFYERLSSTSAVRLIDFENPKNNLFQFTAELTCQKDGEAFRPDITLFVNGLPLAFIEVKKPNNSGGIVAEVDRLNKIRFANEKFRRFINITQLMIFSNNMEYDAEGGIVPIQGAFYCTTSKTTAKFNCFREENIRQEDVAPFYREFKYEEVEGEIEEKILRDFNCSVIHHAPEYQTNLSKTTPTNRILTSMCSKERFLFLIKYGIAYVKDVREEDGKTVEKDEKHIMRYQQFFAARAIRQQLDNGKDKNGKLIKAGIVWHTQGSGKTALSYYLSKILSDDYAKKNFVTKTYFIVDRIDLLEQAVQEFEARGLHVSTVNTRDELMNQFKEQQAQANNTGTAEITVVNIQKFKEDKAKVEEQKYATNLQRIFIVDEAHRGYRPGGCFLANLFEADKEAIKIALTGTPLLKEEYESIKVFDHYFHTYYYDQSIADGYTLKIIREDIETSYREEMSEIYNKLDVLVQKKEITKDQIIEHDVYVTALAKYIIEDLTRFRKIQGDETLGGMVICETNAQARKLYEAIEKLGRENSQEVEITMPDGTKQKCTIVLNGVVKHPIKAGLILHDEGNVQNRKKIVTDFKKNMTIDLLVVNAMLLTGFDAPRLKRLYFGRKVKDHNLLQAITRVNRPYKDNRYGYVIDFADIKENFEKTNEAYLRELTRYRTTEGGKEDGELLDTFRQVMENPSALMKEMEEVRQKLFEYPVDNLEEFSTAISALENKGTLSTLKKALVTAKDCGNLVRTFGSDELKKSFEAVKLENVAEMIREVQRHIDIINQKEAFKSDDETRMLINEAMESITFRFSKKGEEEMAILSQGELNEKWKQVIWEFSDNEDRDDPEYLALYEAFRQRFRECGFEIDSVAQYQERNRELIEFTKKLRELNRRNRELARHYNDDMKFACVHKRIREQNKSREGENREILFPVQDEKVVAMLARIKSEIDSNVYNRSAILRQQSFFEKMVLSVISCEFRNMDIKTTEEDRRWLQSLIAQQYLKQYREDIPA